jgi:Family of unknown function (DUF695)
MNPELANLNVEDSWSVCEGEYRGKPLIVRINTGLRPLVADSRYQHRIGAAVQFMSAGDDGLPSGEESWQVSEIEDLIAAALEAHHESVFAAVITTNGIREFVFYTSDPDAAEKKLVALAEKIDSHEIQRVIHLDADWIVYRQFV